MRRILLAVVVAGLSIAGWARAQVSPVYVTVDRVSMSSNSISISGIPEGGGAVTTQQAFNGNDPVYRDECHRMLLLALSKPGQYLAHLDGTTCTVKVAAP